MNTLAPVNSYPFYVSQNRRLPPANGNYFSASTNDSWTWAPLAMEERAIDKQDDTNLSYNYGSWNGYFPWLKKENDTTKTQWPLLGRRGGLNDAEAFKIQTDCYKTLPDLASTSLPNRSLLDAIQAEIRLNNHLPYEK